MLITPRHSHHSSAWKPEEETPDLPSGWLNNRGDQRTVLVECLTRWCLGWLQSKTTAVWPLLGLTFSSPLPLPYQEWSREMPFVLSHRHHDLTDRTMCKPGGEIPGGDHVSWVDRPLGGGTHPTSTRDRREGKGRQTKTDTGLLGRYAVESATRPATSASLSV
jgi:hypothetical protein